MKAHEINCSGLRFFVLGKSTGASLASFPRMREASVVSLKPLDPRMREDDGDVMNRRNTTYATLKHLLYRAHYGSFAISCFANTKSSHAFNFSVRLRSR